MIPSDDDNGSDNDNSKTMVIQARLQKIQTAIQKATADAYASSSPRAVTATSWLAETNDDESTKSQEQEEEEGTNEGNKATTTTTASFHLGMDLFGADPQVMESQLRDKLEDLESELQRILDMMPSTSNRDDGDDDDVADYVALDDNDSDDVNDDTNATIRTDTHTTIAEQVQVYQAKLQLLKTASLARTALEEAATLASPAFRNAASADVDSDYSLAQASQQLVDAMQHIQSLQDQFVVNPLTNPQEVAAATQIVTSLRHTHRRQKVDLLHQASRHLDTSCSFQSEQITIKSSHKALHDAWTVLETLDTNTNTNTDTNSKLPPSFSPLALRETVRKITWKLFQETFQPMLQHGIHKDASIIEIHTGQDQPTTQRIIGVTTSTNKGIAQRIQWRHSVTPNTDNDDDDDDDDDWPIKVWKNVLHVIQEIIVFVKTHIFLNREEPCKLLTRQFFQISASALPQSLQLQALGLQSAETLGDADCGALLKELRHKMAETCLWDYLQPEHLQTVLPKRRNQLLQICQPFCDAVMNNNNTNTTNEDDNNHNNIPEEEEKGDFNKDRNTNPLLDFCHQLEDNYVQHRKCVLLSEARRILQQDYHNTMKVGAEKKTNANTDNNNNNNNQMEDLGMDIFLFPKSSVSVVAFQLLNLIRQTMQESVDAPVSPAPTLRPTLYQTARQMLTLFRAILPAMHRKEMAMVPRTAAIFSNDCLYLAHACLTLGLEFKGKYSDEDARGKLLQQSCLFVDQVPIFREWADQTLGDLLVQQAQDLSSLVAPRIEYLGQALSSNESLQEWSDAETAWTAAMQSMKQISQAWEPILDKGLYQASMGHLIDATLKLYLEQVQVAPNPFSPPGKHFLIGLFRQAIHDVEHILDPSSMSSTTTTQKSTSSKSIQLPHQRPDLFNAQQGDASIEWSRFQALVQFLEMTDVSQVEDALSRGVFRSVAAAEVAHWIRIALLESHSFKSFLGNNNVENEIQKRERLLNSLTNR